MFDIARFARHGSMAPIMFKPASRNAGGFFFCSQLISLASQQPQGLARVQVAMEAGNASARKASKAGQATKSAKTASKPKASSADNKADKPTGRPSSYTKELGRKVCELLASGQPMTPTRMRENGLPSPATVYRWLEDNESFRDEYTRARQFQAHIYADEIIELADTAEDAGLARIQVDTRKWYASKVIPKLYGDSQRIDVTADIGATAAKVLMDLTQQARDAKAIEHNVIDVTPTLIGENTVKNNK